MASLLSIHGALLLVAPLCILNSSDLEDEAAPKAVLRSHYVSASLSRVEHFALTYGEESSGGEVLGLVEWRERTVEGGRVLERDVFFGGSELTVRHVERLTSDTRRLVWREAATGVGRSQIVEPSGGDLLVVDWLRSGLERAQLERQGSAHFPLALLEAVRAGQRLPKYVSRYWPLTRSVEQLEIETSLLDGVPGIVRRLVEFRRADGSLAGRFLFDGDALEAFQWQDGGPWARRITRDRYRALRVQLAGRGMIEASAEALQANDS